LAIVAGTWLGDRASLLLHAPWFALLFGSAVAGTATLAVLLAFRHVRADELVSLARRGARA
jgi:hypothetical protein